MNFSNTLRLCLLVFSLIFFPALPSICRGQLPAWVAPPSASQIINPIAGSASAIGEGKILYTTYCVACHGDKGKGNGPGAAALNPKPANHTSAAVQNQTDGEIFWKMTEGRGAMVPYKTALTDKQRWSLVCYIRTLKR